MIWFTSDLHLGHNNIIDLCNRPFKDKWDMNKRLVDNWNARVREGEKIFVQGDFSFMGSKATKDVISRLNGHKILIWGNHDKSPHKMLELGFDEVYENYEMILNPGKHRVVLSHFPFAPVQFYCKSDYGVNIQYEQKDKRYLHKRVLDNGKTILLHGHTHSPNVLNGRMIHVGVDAWNYAPVSHEKIIELIEQIKSSDAGKLIQDK